MVETTPDMVQPAPDDIQEVAPEPPKKRGRPVGSKNKSTGAKRGRKRRSLEDKIGGTLHMLNLAFAFAPPEFRGDALDSVEISALAKSLDDAARENPILYKYLDSILGGSGSAMVNLGFIVVAISARRMARHGIYVSKDWDNRIGAFIGMSVGVDMPEVDMSTILADMQGSEVPSEDDRSE